MMRHLLATLITLVLSTGVQAQDFSCMDMEVKSKAQVSDRYMEYDVTFRNNCPGAVFWAACVERIDPWTQAIDTSLEPRGFVEKGKRARVNLQAKRTENSRDGRTAYQWFYVSPAYSLESDISAQCMARPCEAMKADLRKQVSRNDADWQKAIRAMNADAIERCPKTAWDNTEQKTCMENVREEHSAEMQVFSQRESELNRQLEELEPVNCATHGGH